MCYSEIDARAKKCPHCNTLQGVYLLAPFVLILGFAVCFIAVVWLVGGPRSRGWSNRANDVKVVSSRYYFAPGYMQGTSAIVVGKLRNEGDKSLRNAEMEVQFFNPKNELIDLVSGSFSGPVQPKEEAPFKVSDGSNIHLPEADYASHKIRVMNAYEDD
jgi:hypothetical protein